jgi:hypothetical protein
MTLFIWPIAGSRPLYYFNNNDVHDCATGKVAYHVRERKLVTIGDGAVAYWIRDLKLYDDEKCCGPPRFYLGD